MTVADLIKALEAVENKSLNVYFDGYGDYTLAREVVEYESGAGLMSNGAEREWVEIE
jgi:hypothetical protein